MSDEKVPSAEEIEQWLTRQDEKCKGFFDCEVPHAIIARLRTAAELLERVEQGWTVYQATGGNCRGVKFDEEGRREKDITYTSLPALLAAIREQEGDKR